MKSSAIRKRTIIGKNFHDVEKIELYGENGGGYQAFIYDTSGKQIRNGDLWGENALDILLQISAYLSEDTDWIFEDNKGSVNLYEFFGLMPHGH